MTDSAHIKLKKFLSENTTYVKFESSLISSLRNYYSTKYFITSDGLLATYSKKIARKESRYHSNYASFNITDTKIKLTPVQMSILSKLSNMIIQDALKNIITSISKLTDETLIHPLLDAIIEGHSISSYSVNTLFEKLYNIQQHIVRGSNEALYYHEFVRLVRHDNVALMNSIYDFFLAITIKNLGNESLIITHDNKVDEIDFVSLPRPEIKELDTWNSEDPKLTKFLLEEKIYVKYTKYEMGPITNYLITNNGKIGYNQSKHKDNKTYNNFNIHETGLQLTPEQLYFLSKVDLYIMLNEKIDDVIQSINQISKLNTILSSCLSNAILEYYHIDYDRLNRLLGMLCNIQLKNVKKEDVGQYCYEFMTLIPYRNKVMIEEIYNFFISYSQSS